MAVIRVNKTDNYTVMSNYHLRDSNISLKAKGLLSQMLSLPNGWDYTVAGLVVINKESETAIISSLDELKKYGYLVVTKLMPNQTKTGRIEYIYDIYEQPTVKQGIENQGLEFQGVEFQGIENQGQINTNNKDIDNKYIDILNTDNTSLQAEAEHCPFEKIKDLYHSICISYPQIRTIDGNRKKAVSARWRMCKDLNIFEELFTIAENSDFLKGNNDRNWNADFDWFMKPTNFSKVLEHKYDNGKVIKPKQKTNLDVIREMYKEAENEQTRSFESDFFNMRELPELNE